MALSGGVPNHKAKCEDEAKIGSVSTFLINYTAYSICFKGFLDFWAYTVGDLSLGYMHHLVTIIEPWLFTFPLNFIAFNHFNFKNLRSFENPIQYAAGAAKVIRNAFFSNASFPEGI